MLDIDHSKLERAAQANDRKSVCKIFSSAAGIPSKKRMMHYTRAMNNHRLDKSTMAEDYVSALKEHGFTKHGDLVKIELEGAGYTADSYARILNDAFKRAVNGVLMVTNIPPRAVDTLIDIADKAMAKNSCVVVLIAHEEKIEPFLAEAAKKSDDIAKNFYVIREPQPQFIAAQGMKP